MHPGISLRAVVFVLLICTGASTESAAQSNTADARIVGPESFQFGNSGWDARFGPPGPSGVRLLEADDEEVFTGYTGSFARWNFEAETWQSLPGTGYAFISDIHLTDSVAYAGGRIAVEGAFRPLAAWDRRTESWKSLGGAGDWRAGAIEPDGAGRLFVAVEIESGDNDMAITRVDPVSEHWTAPFDGPGGHIRDMVVSGSELYVLADDHRRDNRSYIARRDGSEWTEVMAAEGWFSSLVALAGGDIMAGGCFERVAEFSAGHPRYVPITNLVRVSEDELTAPFPDLASREECVSALHSDDDRLYAAIQPSNSALYRDSRLVYLENGEWVTYGSRIVGGVEHITTGGGRLIIGGRISAVNSMVADGVAALNMVTRRWESMIDDTALGANLFVFAIEAGEGDDVYVGGRFRTIGNVLAEGISRWNGEFFESMGTGLRGGLSPGVYAIEAAAGRVFIGGEFESVDGVEAHNVAQWSADTQSWRALADGLTDRVTTLLASGDALFAMTRGAAWSWDGTRWSHLGRARYHTDRGEFDGSFRSAVLDTDGSLLVSGEFNRIGSKTAGPVARYRAGRWVNMGAAPERGGSLVIHQGEIYLAGNHTAPMWRTSLARWNPSDRSWTIIDGGLEIHDTLCSVDVGPAISIGTHIIVGGGLSGCAKSGRSQRPNLAMWDGETWTDVGGGTSGDYVYSFGMNGSDLWLGGAFDAVGGVPSRFIARWRNVVALDTAPGAFAHESLDVQLYPTPAANDVTLEFDTSTQGNWEIGVFDVTGRRVLRRRSVAAVYGPRQVTLDLSDLVAGVYVCRILTPAGATTKTIVKTQ